MATVTVLHPAGYGAERKYIVETLFKSFLGVDASAQEAPVAAWEVRCGDESFTVPDVLFATDPAGWLQESSLPSDASLYGDDLFGGAFFMLTRYEELALPDRDTHGRFPAIASFAARHGLLNRPLVNEIADVLWNRLSLIAPRLERCQRTLRVVPSHDVDYPRASMSMRLAALKSGKLRAVLPRDPYDTFDLLMESSERRGLRASFYFMAAGAPYSLDERPIRRLLRRIHERGHEIGLHTSYEAFRDGDATRSEFETLLRVCAEERIDQSEWGGRAHFLRWNPECWSIWNDVGLSYDSSVGFSEHPGFRAGTCYEYPTFDLKARRALPLRERPLVVMDNPGLALIEPNAERVTAVLESLRSQCRRHGGDFTTLWHNNWLITTRRRRLLQMGLGVPIA